MAGSLRGSADRSDDDDHGNEDGTALYSSTKLDDHFNTQRISITLRATCYMSELSRASFKTRASLTYMLSSSCVLGTSLLVALYIILRRSQ